MMLASRLGGLVARLLGVVLLVATAGATRAASTISVPLPARTWTDLGAGPLLTEVNDRSIPTRFAIADVAPTSSQVGFLDVRMFQTASHVWAWSTQANAVTVAPIAAAAVGGGGTSSANAVPLASGTSGIKGATLGTGVINGFVQAAPAGKPRQVVSIRPQLQPGDARTITVCSSNARDQNGNPITPTAYVAGCDTVGVNGQITYPAFGYVPQEALNAVGSAAGIPITIELH